MTASAIILVAGLSSRIQEVTKGHPKCFLEVGGETLIGRSLRLLRAAGVDDITLVTGFMADVFHEAFPSCRFVTNTSYKSTNTAVSLRLALEARARASRDTDDLVLVLNGDVYYDDGIIPGMLAVGDTCAAIKRHALTHEEVKVFVEDGRVTRIGKYLAEDLAYGEAFGIYALSPRFSVYLLRELRLLNNPTIFYEAGMDRLLSGGHVVRAHDVGDALVQEIDFPADYFDLQAMLADR